ncbi:PEP-CTERM sorting domain-containing protein [bacterium]|nr:PEP-CTERM sorting domain-containing protein [bacterium]
MTAGLELWLDAADTSTLFQDAAMTTAVTAAGQSVRGWADKSGNTNHVTTGGTAPTFQTGVIGGQDVVRFNRGQLTDASGLNIAANQDRTVFVVMEYTTQTNNNEILGTSTGAMLDVGNWSSAERLRVRNGGTSLFSPAEAVPVGTHILQVGGTAASTAAFREALPIISAPAAAFNWAMNPNLAIGGANFLSPSREYVGDLAEVIVYDRVLTARESDAVGYHLAQKYGMNTVYSSGGNETLRYTFDGLTGGGWPGTSLIGQDGWVHIGNDTGINVISNGAGNTWSLNESAYRPNNGDSQMTRPDSIGLHTHVTRMAMTVRARSNGGYMMSLGLRDTETGEVTFQFGLQNNNWFLRPADFGTQVNVAAGLTSTSLGYLVVLEIDQAAAGGDGLGSLFIQNLTDGSALSPVAGLQDIALGLLRMDFGAHNPSTWDGLYIRMAGGGSSIDNIFVESIVPEPATLSLLGLGGLAALRRRRRTRQSR